MKLITAIISLLRRHILVLMALIIGMLLILCPVSIGLIYGHYSNKIEEVRNNIEDIEYSLERSVSLTEYQNRLLRDQNIMMYNMALALNNFHDNLKHELEEYFRKGNINGI